MFPELSKSTYVDSKSTCVDKKSTCVDRSPRIFEFQFDVPLTVKSGKHFIQKPLKTIEKKTYL